MGFRVLVRRNIFLGKFDNDLFALGFQSDRNNATSRKFKLEKIFSIRIQYFSFFENGIGVAMPKPLIGIALRGNQTWVAVLQEKIRLAQEPLFQSDFGGPRIVNDLKLFFYRKT